MFDITEYYLITWKLWKRTYLVMSPVYCYLLRHLNIALCCCNRVLCDCMSCYSFFRLAVFSIERREEGTYLLMSPVYYYLLRHLEYQRYLVVIACLVIVVAYLVVISGLVILSCVLRSSQWIVYG